MEPTIFDIIAATLLHPFTILAALGFGLTFLIERK